VLKGLPGLLLVIQAFGCGASTTPPPSGCDTAPPPPATEVPRRASAIELRLERLGPGCDTVLVSSGIPLAPGTLMPAQLSRIRLFVGGAEQRVYVEPLRGVHPDGSLRAVLVQFHYAVRFEAPLPAQLVVGEARGTRDIAKPNDSRTTPAAVVLPTDPRYLVSTQLVGPTMPIDSAASTPVIAKYDSDFQQYADKHWNQAGASWSENYYDRALIYYAWWVRSGKLEYWKRATALAASYRIDYLQANNYAASPHWAQLEGLEIHYLLTGDEASRDAVLQVAARFHDAFHPTLGHTDNWWENRIQARVLQAYLLAWRLQATGNATLNWAALLDDGLTRVLGTQRADGSYRFTQLCGESLNYMTGLLNDVLIKYYTYYKPDTRIPPAIRRSVDFLWDTQWLPSAQTFKYLSGPCAGVGDATPAPDLNNLMVTGFGWTYRQTGDAAYRDRAEQIFAGGVNGAFLSGTKQFNEEYTASFRYLSMR